MIKTILHQIWNERRQNGWLFLELVAVSVFLWLAIDPLFILYSNKYIPEGYNDDNLYYLEFEVKSVPDEENAGEVCANDFEQAVNIVRSLPEVDAYAVASSNNYPNSMGSNCPKYVVDSTMNVKGESHSMHVTTYDIYDFPGSDYFAALQIKDINGEPMKKSGFDGGKGLYVSQNFAQKVFGTTDAAGKKIKYEDEDEIYSVAGLFSTVQTTEYIEPMYLIMHIHDRSEICEYIDKRYIFENYKIFVRLKEGVAADAFMKNFQAEIAPKLDFKYRRFFALTAVGESAAKSANVFGITNRYRMQMMLSGFALFCAFLGIMSTYWVRVSDRRMAIGLYRSMGATSRRVLWQFIVEGWLIVSVAFLIALPLLMHKVYSMGFSDPLEKFTSMMWQELMLAKNGDYLHNQPLTHFVIVSVLTYLFMLFVAGVGILIPTRRIVSIQPSEALRDE